MKKRIDIDLSRQSLRLYDGRKLLREYKVSTAGKSRCKARSSKP